MFLKSAGNQLARGFIDLIFPPRCPVCGAFPPGPGRDVKPSEPCPECRAGLPPLPEAYCLSCGRPFQTPLASVHVCTLCRRVPPAYDRALASGLYQARLRTAIHLFKYSRQTELARPLAAFMADNLSPPFYPPQADLILPVPLHRRRLRQRGFNQALLLARALFKPWEHLIRYDLLIRTRWTEPQVNLKGAQRLKNVSQAFALTRPEDVKGRSVLILDDVYTTGATVMECARVLKKAGAREVLVLTLARVA